MANNYVQPGEIIDHAPAVDVASGQATVIGQRIGIAQTDVPAGVEGAFAVEGVHRLPNAADAAVGQGEPVYLTNDREVTGAADGNTLAGYAFRPAAAADLALAVKINA